jgi:predicted transporter
MIQRIIDDFKETTAAALRLTSLAAAAAVALFITISFLCAAAFVVVLDTYGLVQACLSGAALFFVVTLIAAGIYIARKKQVEARAKTATKSAMHTALADPMVIAMGLQVIRSVGIKRLIPLLAVGGLALGFLASRQNVGDQTPAE